MEGIDLQKQIVHTTSLFKKDEEFKDERFMRVRVAAMHTGINRNNSRFSKECIENAKDTFANIPILADVQVFTDKDGNQVVDYRGHSMHVEDDLFNEDKQRIIYDEKVVGLVPETNNFELVYDGETDEYYVWIDALLYREYGNYACDVLESRGGQTDVSMEIGCDDISYSASDKCLDVGKMMACGLTLLGEDVKPGMAKAHAEVFSMNDDNRKEQLIQIIQELKESLDNYIQANANTKLEEGGKVVKFNELLEKYGKTVEDITFEYESLSDEELETKFAEVFEEENSSEDGTDPESTSDGDDGDDNSDEGEVVDETDDEPETEPTTELNSIKPEKYSVQLSDGSIKEFELSLDEIQCALYSLVNETYAEADNTYYGVSVYESHIIMHDWWNGKNYKQTYKREGDNFALTGDRVEVFSNWLTKDEETALADLRKNYSSIESQLKEYQEKEENAQKDALFVSEDYSSISDKEEFKALEENHAEFSVDDLKSKLDAIILDYAKKGNLSFSAEPDKKNVGMTRLPIQTKTTKKSRYGSIFSK